MDRESLERRIAKIINKKLAAKERPPVPWIIQELVNALGLPLLSDKDKNDELEIVVREGYRQIVGGVIRNLERKRQDPDPQPVFPGFERLQAAYSIVRDGKETVVSIHEMTQTEAYAKRAELVAMRNGLDTHIREWDRYIEARWPLLKKLTTEERA